MKRILTVCGTLIFLMAGVLPVSAASGEECLTLAAAIKGEDIIAAAPAVVCNDGGACRVITDAAVYASGADKYVTFLEEQNVAITYQQELSEELAAFSADKSNLTRSGVLDIAQSIQVGEELTYYFYYSGDNVAILEGSARIIEENGRQLFNITLPDGVGQDRINYPAIAVNRSGELAVIETKQSTLPLGSIEGSDTGSAPGQVPPSPSSPPKGRGEPDTSTEPAPAPAPKSGLPVDTIVGVAAVGAVAAVAAVLFRKKAGAKGSVPPAQPIAPTQPMDPVPPTVPDIPERIEPVEIKAKSSVLYLCCEGGVLDGRRYPVGAATLLIGRDPSCNICYPADTRGVSRRHCQIFWRNGVLHIMDLGSTSGTFIRGKGQIMANAPVAVNAGDTFYLGEKRNAFVIRMGDEG